MAKKIRCRWEQDKRLLVNPDGQAFPCCYLSNNYYQSTVYEERGTYDELPDGHKANIEHPVMAAYFECQDEYNVFKTDVNDILTSQWFTETLPNSWDSDETVHFQCKRMCEIDE